MVRNDPWRVASQSPAPTSKEAAKRTEERRGVNQEGVKHVQMIRIGSRLSTGSCFLSLSLSLSLFLSITLCPIYPPFVHLPALPILLSISIHSNIF